VEQLIGDEASASATPGLADVYLIPQLYAAERFNIDLAASRASRVAALAEAHPAFAKAHPARHTPAQ
jgi:maleylacetoacetate isomerase